MTDALTIEAGAIREAKRHLYCILRVGLERESYRGSAPYDHAMPCVGVDNPVIWWEYLLTSPNKVVWDLRVFHTTLRFYNLLHEDFERGRLYGEADMPLFHHSLSHLRADFQAETARDLMRLLGGNVIPALIKVY